jgi:nitroimidazol reductase NimA-like FMN-containing flavoprotein (pyridoxamine 5'-phosphate oxidase superfamily)
MEQSAPSARTKVQRLPNRGAYDQETLWAILDEGLVCHVGFVTDDGQPLVLPTTHVRVGEQLYLHGAAANRMLNTLSTGVAVCVTVTLLDGLVLARAAFKHSMNYRSVVVFGRAKAVTDAAEKRRILTALVEHVMPGRSAEVRGPNDKELAATLLLVLPLDEASAKIRRGPPVDDPLDYGLDVWAGELPLRLRPLPPVRDPKLSASVDTPEQLARYRREPSP